MLSYLSLVVAALAIPGGLAKDGNNARDHPTYAQSSVTFSLLHNPLLLPLSPLPRRSPHALSLYPRQNVPEPGSIPPGCESACAGLEEAAANCEEGTSNGANSAEAQRCLDEICSNDGWRTFVGCMQCEIDVGEYTYSEQDARTFNQAVSALGRACGQTGRPVQQIALNLTTSENPNMPQNAASPRVGLTPLAVGGAAVLAVVMATV